MEELFNEDMDRESGLAMSKRKPQKTRDMAKLEDLLEETDAEVSLQRDLRSADSLERPVSKIHAPSPLAMRTVQIASTPDDFEKEHVVRFEQTNHDDDVSQNLSARLDEAESTPRKREMSMSELGDEDTKGAIEHIFDNIQDQTTNKIDNDVDGDDDDDDDHDERNESILTTPGRGRSWERLNRMYAQHGFSETPIFVSEDDRVRVDVKLLIDSTRALFEKYEERGDLIQQMSGDVKRAESRVNERDLASSQNSARSERTIRQQTNLTRRLRERVGYLEKQLDLERKRRRTLEMRTERTKREFKQQLKYSKHAARVHERAADKLKEKLRKEYERQSSLKTRGEELLRQHRVSSPAASTTNTVRTPSSKQKMRNIHASFLDTPMSTRSTKSRNRKMLNMSGTSSVFSSVSTTTTQSRRRSRVTREMLLEIVGVFEKQQKDTLRDVARLQRELDNANRNISKLCNADLKAEREIKLEDDMWEGQDAMSQREARLFAQLKRWRVEQQKVLDAQKEWRIQIEDREQTALARADAERLRADKMEEERDVLKSELEARPSTDQWSEAQRELEKQRKELRLLSSFLSEKDLKKWSIQSEATRKLIQSDRGVESLYDISPAVARRSLGAACRALQLDDPSSLVPAIAKLRRVVDAANGMQTFITEVMQVTCAVDLSQAVSTIRGWKKRMEAGVSIRGGLRECERAINRFREIFELKEDEDPEEKMNQLRTFMRESAQFFHSLRGMLSGFEGVKKLSSAQCLKVVKRLIVRCREYEAVENDENSGETKNYVVTKRGKELDGIGRVREMHDQLKMLRNIFGVETNSELLSRCKEVLSSSSSSSSPVIGKN